jgi:anaerobic selenocysteine-containing dehydrogenase
MNQTKKVVKSICKSCHGGCGVLVTIEHGRITAVKGNPLSLTRGTMCIKGRASLEDVYHPDRLLYPNWPELFFPFTRDTSSPLRLLT